MTEQEMKEYILNHPECREIIAHEYEAMKEQLTEFYNEMMSELDEGLRIMREGEFDEEA